MSSRTGASLGSNAFLQRNYDGDVHTITGNLTVNPNTNLSLTLRYNRSWVDVPDGDDDAVSANVRLHLIHSPGSDLFIVFNEQRGTDSSLWDFSDRGAVVKAMYLKRF